MLFLQTLFRLYMPFQFIQACIWPSAVIFLNVESCLNRHNYQIVSTLECLTKPLICWNRCRLKIRCEYIIILYLNMQYIIYAILQETVQNSSTPPEYLPRGARSEGAFICAPLRSAGGQAFSRGLSPAAETNLLPAA